MAFNGSGTFVRVHNWTSDAAASIDITDSRMDAEDDGFATGLTACLTKNGESTPTADLPMGGFAHTGVALSGARTEYARTDQVQDSLFTYAADTGSADAYAIALSPTVTAYVAGQRFTFIAGNTNTGAATLDVNSVGTQTINTWDGSALPAGAITSGSPVDVVYDGTNFILMSAEQPTVTAATASQAEMEAGTETAVRSVTPQRVYQAVDYYRGLRVRADSTTETLTAAMRNGCTIATLTGDITKTLPAISTLPSGCIYAFQVISNSGTDKMSIVPNAADNIHFADVIAHDVVEMVDVGDYVELLADDVNGVWRVAVDRIAGPYFEASYVGAGQALTGDVYTKLQYNTEASDSHGNYDPTTNYRFTPTIPGWYTVEAVSYIALNGNVWHAIYKNGSNYREIDYKGSSTALSLVSPITLYLNGSTDYIEMYARPNASATFDDVLDSTFRAKRVKS